MRALPRKPPALLLVPDGSSQLQLVRRFGADSKNTSGVLDQVLKARVVTVALGGVLS
jgi:hypothetical protein